MTLPEDIPAPQVDPTLTSSIGYTSLEGSIGARAVDFDVRVAAIEPAMCAAAGATPYEGTAKKGPNIGDAPSQAEQAIAYARTVFPDSNFSFVGSGRYGVDLNLETTTPR